jgi:Zn-dependent oligopeptidases
MRNGLAAIAAVAMAMPGFAQPVPVKTAETNPFFTEWRTPFGIAPFDRIRPEHFVPAFEAAIAERKKEVESIAANPAPPTFANTVEALENGGPLLAKVSPVFYALTGADTNDELQAINRKVAPLLSSLRDDVVLNEALFTRVKAVWEKRETSSLTPEQKKLVEETYKDFVRGGANLAPEQKKRYREINQELSAVGIRFGDNLLKETNGYRLVVEKKADLAGLPAGVVAAAADAAKAAKLDGKWVFTLQYPSIWPFLTFSENRELRRQLLTAYSTRCDKGDESDNKASSRRWRRSARSRAKLLGFATWADFVLDDNMAKTPARVYELLDRVWKPALEVAKADAKDSRRRCRPTCRARSSSRGTGTTTPRRSARRASTSTTRSSALLPARPRPRGGLLRREPALRDHVHRAEGRPEVPRRGEHVRGEGRGRDVPRALTRRTTTRGRQARRRLVRPPARPVGEGRQGRPPDRHERHELHPPGGRRPGAPLARRGRDALPRVRPRAPRHLSRVTYRSMAGVPRDFVELPSQIMENWALEPTVLAGYAKHWKTNEPIPGPRREDRKSSLYGRASRRSSTPPPRTST